MTGILLLLIPLISGGPVFADQPLPGLFDRSAPPEGLYLIERKGLESADWHLAAIIQGMASRERPELYLVNSGAATRGDRVFLAYYEKEYGVNVLGEFSVREALKKYAHRFSGYVLFSFDEGWTVNVADTYCSIHNCLPVTAKQEPWAKQAGLERVEDFRGRWKNSEDAVFWSLAELFPECSKKTVASLNPEHHASRDYFYAHRVFTFYLAAGGREYYYFRRLMKSLPHRIPVMGYIARNGIEEWVVEYTLAETSKFMAPTDNTPNLTVHSGIPIRPLPALEDWPEPPDIRGKLALVFALTDGDNLAMQFEYYLKPGFWLNPRRGELKLAWSVGPELYELAPGIMRYYYETRTPNDFFVVLSGAGYTFTSAFRDSDYFRDLSLTYMKLTGLNVLWALDPLLYFPVHDKIIGKVLDPLGADGYIRGVLAGYAPPVTMRAWSRPSGYPPILFCRPNYFQADNKTLLRMLKAETAHIPKRGEVVFYGVNGWEVSYDDLIAILSELGRDDVILLSPQEAFAIIEGWQAD